jgi:pimeloyl-ACP methyl ester carboxylesterase
MPITTINGVRLFWEQHGESGAPLVLVHGSWGDHHNWDAVVPGLARSFRVFTFDRRGHSQSERVPTQGSIQEDVADLAEFITTNNLAPAHIAGNSFGAAITLKGAAARPSLFASATVHEPPLMGMLADDPLLPLIGERVGTVLRTLEAGDLEGGARQFVENVALGPGMWEKLPPDMRQTFVFNAPTWMDEMREQLSDPTAVTRVMTVDLPRLATFTQPLLITRGDQSPPFFSAILDKIAAAVPQVQQYTFRGAGHVPHLTHADEYVRVVTDFIRRDVARTASS